MYTVCSRKYTPSWFAIFDKNRSQYGESFGFLCFKIYFCLCLNIEGLSHTFISTYEYNLNKENHFKEGKPNSLFLSWVRIDGMVKVRNLKKHMERLNEVVTGLKEGKQEMSKQVQELGSAIDALLAKIKVRLHYSQEVKDLSLFDFTDVQETIVLGWKTHLIFVFHLTVFSVSYLLEPKHSEEKNV